LETKIGLVIKPGIYKPETSDNIFKIQIF